MSQSYDAIVIGGNVHGLATASLLAKKGKKVLLLERSESLGGLHKSVSFGRGFSTAGMIPVVDKVDPKLVQELALAKHGLEFASAPHLTTVLSKDGKTAFNLSSDLEATSALVKSFAPDDAQGLLAIHGFLGRIRDLFTKLMTGPQINLVDMSASNIWELLPKALGLRLLGSRDMFDVIRLLPMCLADFLAEHLKNDAVKGALSVQALAGTWLGPWSPGSTTNFMLERLASGPRVVGGGPALVKALESSAKAHGVSIRCGAIVMGITVDSGRATGVKLESGEEIQSAAIWSALDSHTTLINMLPARALTTKSMSRLRSYRSRGTTAVLHFGLKSKPAIKGLENGFAFQSGDHVDSVERAFDPVKYRALPDAPILQGWITTLDQSGTAPNGAHVLTIHVGFVPYDLKETDTSKAEQQIAAVVERQLEAWCPGFAALVEERVVLSPRSIEKEFGVVGGHFYDGEISLDQIFMRPIPECSRYTTPVEGLHLCGTGLQMLSSMVGTPALQAIAAN